MGQHKLFELFVNSMFLLVTLLSLPFFFLIFFKFIPLSFAFCHFALTPICGPFFLLGIVCYQVKIKWWMSFFTLMELSLYIVLVVGVRVDGLTARVTEPIEIVCYSYFIVMIPVTRLLIIRLAPGYPKLPKYLFKVNIRFAFSNLYIIFLIFSSDFVLAIFRPWQTDLVDNILTLFFCVSFTLASILKSDVELRLYLRSSLIDYICNPFGFIFSFLQIIMIFMNAIFYLIKVYDQSFLHQHRLVFLICELVLSQVLIFVSSFGISRKYIFSMELKAIQKSPLHSDSKINKLITKLQDQSQVLSQNDIELGFYQAEDFQVKQSEEIPTESQSQSQEIKEDKEE